MKAMKCALLVQCAFIPSHAFCLPPARISSSANKLGGYHEGQDAFEETLKCFRILSADKAQEGVFGWQKAASHKVIFVAYISQRTLNIATTIWLTERYPWELQKNWECLGVV